MTGFEHMFPLIILIIGILVVLAMLVKAGLERLGLPALVGFLLLGFALRGVDAWCGILTKESRDVFKFLADVGVICLLFRIGLESNLRGLLSQLQRASLVWLANVGLSGAGGFLVGRYLLGLALIPCLFLAVAMTATSVGVSVWVWRRVGALQTPQGELLLDVAELDDMSGVLLMALLFAVAPALHAGEGTGVLSVLGETTLVVLAKLLSFGLLCFLFSLYVERHVTGLSKKLFARPDPMLVLVGAGLIMAAVAGVLGFSLAIGAFFAGLAFSRDPNAVKMEASFVALYELFVPFFFVHIGLGIELETVGAAVWLGSLLFVVAAVTKVTGTALPAWVGSTWRTAALLGISMVPRAEITMIVMEYGRSLGDWAVPPRLFSAMAIVSAMTCVAIPLVLNALLRRWPAEQTS
jgi:Kef-type K+ transport system membrane component KefB